MLIGISEIGSRNITANTHGVKVMATTQTGFNVAQTFAESDLSESHRKELIAGSHATTGSRHWIACDASGEFFRIEDIDDLGENESAGVHPLLRMIFHISGHSIQMQDTSLFQLAS